MARLVREYKVGKAQGANITMLAILTVRDDTAALKA